jgi:hypothetical protein
LLVKMNILKDNYSITWVKRNYLFLSTLQKDK